MKDVYMQAAGWSASVARSVKAQSAQAQGKCSGGWLSGRESTMSTMPPSSGGASSPSMTNFTKTNRGRG